MNEHTAISWTDTTWNAVHGCARVSDGCRFCYAETLSLKFGWSKKPWTKQDEAENVRLRPDKLGEPYKLKGSHRIFVNSMSDAFHPLIPDEYIARMFAVMNDLPQHQFQILTKRPERLATWPGPWSPNIWAGATVEDRKALPRIDLVRQSGALIRMLSCEPLLESLGVLDLTGIHWIIAGGESGNHMRNHPERWMDHAWARELRDQCVDQGVAYFFKQSSGYRTEMGTTLKELDGSRSTWQQYPADLPPTLTTLL